MFASADKATSTGQSSPKQKQPHNCEGHTSKTLPRRRFVEKQDACERHDGGAARKDCRNRGEWTTFLEKKEKRDRAGADANASKQGITKTSSTKFLAPSSREPEDRQVDQDRQCRAGFDNETTKSFADALGRETCKNLVCAVKHSGKD